MYINHLSLTNQRIRNALKKCDSSLVTETVLLLVNGDEEKALELGEWFRSVAEKCKKGVYINEDIAMMRMWQIGNVDIKEVQDDGSPLFVLTFSGSQIVKNLPQENWFNALLWEGETKEAA